jgi:hypothetical protein
VTVRFLHRARQEFWWFAEQHAGRLWLRVCPDGVSCWLDWLPSFCLSRRYAAERALNPELFEGR